MARIQFRPRPPLPLLSMYLPSFCTYAGVLLTWLSIRPLVLLLLLTPPRKHRESAAGATDLGMRCGNGNGLRQHGTAASPRERRQETRQRARGEGRHESLRGLRRCCCYEGLGPPPPF